MTDPVLSHLLLEELARHEPALGADVAVEAQRMALHALKGSAGLAGENSLSQTLARLERRLAEGDQAAATAARTAVAAALVALRSGQPIPQSRWPEPPDDLRARPIDPAVFDRYAAEMRDRLTRIDVALAGSGDDAESAAAAFRETHAMKGAALAVGDDVVAWFCHGLEEQLRHGARSEAAARRALDELARWRGVLAELVVQPERALETLRLIAPRERSLSRPPLADPLPLPPRRPSDEVEPESRAPAGEASLRVPAATLDRLFERVSQLGQTNTRVAEGADEANGSAARARRLRHLLAEALRLIGPPKPWGAPAAAVLRIEEAARGVSALADRLEREATRLQETADRVRAEAASARGELAGMRTTRVGWLFDRVAAAIQAQARREGMEVRLTLAGGETPIDRPLAEALLDPVLQLARNAVAHGIESASERASRGKPRVGTVHLAAEARSGGLRLRVQDDGAGVDVARLRLRAVAAGTISAEVERAADDQTLLAVLFVPGFTTRDRADLLAGRGVGLDLARGAVRRLGGTIRLASQHGVGLSATLDVPVERGQVKALWIEASGELYALPVQHVQRLLLASDADARRAAPLAACLRATSAADAHPALHGANAVVLELEPVRDGEPAPMIAVDRVRGIEEIVLHAVSPIVTAAGPFAGAVVRGDELRLCLDAHALAEIAAALGSRGAVQGSPSAERAGFEPADQFPDRTLSKRVP